MEKLEVFFSIVYYGVCKRHLVLVNKVWPELMGMRLWTEKLDGYFGCGLCH